MEHDVSSEKVQETNLSVGEKPLPDDLADLLKNVCLDEKSSENEPVEKESEIVVEQIETKF